MSVPIRINKHQFFIESHTTTGVFYKLEWSRNQRRFLCSCMDSTCRKHECKHGQEIRDFFQKIIKERRQDELSTENAATLRV